MGECLRPSFNLVREPWIPVVMLDGSHDELSLRELFKKAQDIREVVGDIPQQVLPILRLCEAILYRAYGRTEDGEPLDLTEPEMLQVWKAVWGAGSFADGYIDEYLDDFEARFDLFGPAPFMQVPDLAFVSKDKEYDPIEEILADVPKSGKFLFSMRSRDAPACISFPEAARWLLFFQAYDCAGIKTPVVGNTHVNKGKVYAPKGLPATGWLGCIGGTYLEGANLFQTLLYNWVLFQDSRQPLFGNQKDLPSWEKSAASHDYRVRKPAGPAELYSLQSRRVRLVPHKDGKFVVGIISCYGDIPRPTETVATEQMTPWRKSVAQQKALGTTYVPWMPRVHDCSKALWRGLEAVLSRGEVSEGDFRPGVVRWYDTLRAKGGVDLPAGVTVHAQGVEYGSQSSVMTKAMDDRVDLGTALLRGDSPAVTHIFEIISSTDKAIYQLVVLVRSVEHSQGDMSRDKDPQAQRVADDVRERAYSELDGVFRSRIANFSAEVSVVDYCNAWYSDIHRILLTIARSYLNESGNSVFQRRPAGCIAEAVSKFRWQLNKILGPIGIERRNEGGTNR